MSRAAYLYYMYQYAVVHSRLIKAFIYSSSQTEHDMEMELTTIDFFHQVTEDSRSSWLQILDNQLIDCSPYIRYTNRK